MNDLEDEPEVTTLRCPDCEEQITAPVKGRQNATFRLASHRYSRHGVRSDSKRRSKADADAAAERLVERPALATVREIGEAAGAGRRSGTPTAEELARGLGRGLSITTMIGAAFVVERDPGIPPGPAGDARREELMRDLVLSDRDAAAMLAPIGRAMHRTKLNAKYGRGVVDNIDALAAVGDLGLFMARWYRYLAQRTAGPVMVDAGGYPIGPAAGAPAAPPPGTVEQAGIFTTPPPAAGRIITAEDVARMQRGA